MKTDDKAQNPKRIIMGVIAGLSFGAAVCAADSDTTYTIDIKAQSTNSALMQLARETGVQIVFPNHLGKDATSPAVVGEFTLDQALTKILADAGLQYQFTDSDQKTLVILESESAAQGAAKSSDSVKKQDSMIVEEMIVTAQKRGAVSIQDTAMSVSAISSEAIEKRGLVGMDDYLRTLPGVSFHDRGAGQNTIVIRGLSTDPQAEKSTSGVYFGETPITDLGTQGVADVAGSLDIKLVDVERVEVLRGPQGTLYGSGSMGGTVRVIPASPNLNTFEGKVAMRYSSTGQLGGDNNMVQGVINVPIVEDTLAVRAVAYRFDNSGYIENVINNPPTSPGIGAAIGSTGVAQNRGDVGSDEYTGFRVTALWQPTEQFDVTLSYLDQEIEQDGFPEINLLMAGDFQQERLNTGPDGSRYESLANDVAITNLVINYDMGWASLSSSSSLVDYSTVVESDLSMLFGIPVYAMQTREEDVLIEELRLTSQLDGRAQFIVGLYYEDREADVELPWLWSGAAALDPGVPIIFSTIDESLDQLAFFGEFSWQFTDQFTATFGLRHFDYENSRFQQPNDAAPRRVKEDGETYKFNLSYDVNDNTLLYGQWAEGFRLGTVRSRPNPMCDADNDGNLDDVGFPAPEGVDSDTLESFELGLKTSLLEDRLTMNMAVYRTNWDGIPVSFPLPSCNSSVFLNAGKSTVDGAELEIQAYPSENLRLNFSASYNDATLAEDAPNIGSAGDNLPGSADLNASLGMEYLFNLAGYQAFVRGDYAYVDEYYSNVAEVGQASGGYGQINLKTGMAIGNLDIDLFVNNLTNADDFTWTEAVYAQFNLSRAYRLRPRTIGLNIGYHF